MSDKPSDEKANVGWGEPSTAIHQEPSKEDKVLAVLLRIEQMLENQFNPNHTLRHHLATRASDGKPDEL